MALREVAGMAMGERANEDQKEEREEVNLRAPKSMLAEARRRANLRGISLNAWICDAIADRLDDTGRIVPFRKT